MKLAEKEIQKKLKDLKNWHLKEDKLFAEYEFKDFKETFAIMTRIAFEAEKLQHHPEWKNTYNTLEIFLTTHDENGITEKDFELAKSIDKII